MQIVIDISETRFRDLQRIAEVQFGSKYFKTAEQIIAKGTPIPKGHGDLIDKGIFKKWIETQDGDRLMTEYYIDALDAQETIIEAEGEEV